MRLTWHNDSERNTITLFLAAFWTAVWTVDVLKDAAMHAIRGDLIQLRVLILDPAPWWLAWIAVTPVVLAINRRFEPDKRGWPAFVVAHVFGSVLVTAAHLSLASLAFELRNGQEVAQWFPADVQRFLVAYGLSDLLNYFAVAVGSQAVVLYKRFREKQRAADVLEKRAAELQQLMTEARLNALRSELNPHFLFNALNSIAALVRQGRSNDAVTMIAKLADLLRRTLDSGDEPEVTLEREMELVRSYLAIEGIRFADRLDVEIECPASVHSALVPTLLLQPLVENAVKHGVARRVGKSWLCVSAVIEAAAVIIRVRDTGGSTDSVVPISGPQGGIGLANTRERLHRLYGDAGSVSFTRLSRGAESVVRIPLQRAATGLEAGAAS